MNNVIFNQTDKLEIWGSGTEEEKFDYLLNVPDIMKILPLIKVNQISLGKEYQQQYNTYSYKFTVALECNGKVLIIKKEENLKHYVRTQEGEKIYHTRITINNNLDIHTYIKEIFGNQDDDLYYGEAHIMRNIEELEREYIYKHKLMPREFRQAAVIKENNDLPF